MPDAEIDYQTFLSLVHPEDRQRVDIAAQQAMTANGTGEYHCQYRVIRPDGQVRWLEANGAGPVFATSRGCAGQSASSAPRWTSPIASRPRKPTGSLAAIVESSEDAIISKTLDGRILTWNGGAEKLYGYSAQEAVGKSISMLVPPEQPDELLHILKKLERGERITQLRNRPHEEGRHPHRRGPDHLAAGG